MGRAWALRRGTITNPTDLVSLEQSLRKAWVLGKLKDANDSNSSLLFLVHCFPTPSLFFLWALGFNKSDLDVFSNTGSLGERNSSLRLQGAGFSLQRWHQLWGERGPLVAPASWSIWSNSSYPTSVLRFRSRARFNSRLLSPLHFPFIFFSGLNISSVSDREKCWFTDRIRMLWLW